MALFLGLAFLSARSGKVYTRNRKFLIWIGSWDTSAGRFVECDVSLVCHLAVVVCISSTA